MLYYYCLTIGEGSDMIRLDKYLADTGAASRREAKMYIRRGEVTVDGVLVTSVVLAADMRASRLMASTAL